MRKKSLSSVFCLLSSLAFAAPSMTDTFVYSADFGMFDAQGNVRTVDVTTNVTMTVGIYGSSSSGAQPLWCRRLEVPVWDGQFTVELDDAHGTSDPELNPKYAFLSDLVAALDPSAEWWIGISRPRIGDQKPAGVTEDNPARGKLSAVPFALQTERVAAARGDFTVSGSASVSKLVLADSLTVTNDVSFRGNVTFVKRVTFDGLVVSGQLTRPKLELELLRAEAIAATGRIVVDRMVITNGLATTIRPGVGNVSGLKNVSVDGTLDAQGGVRVNAVSAPQIVIRGTLTLESGAKIDWRRIGDDMPELSAPDGIYPAAVTVSELRNSTDTSPSYSNGSTREMLTSLVLSCRNGTNKVCLASMNADLSNVKQPWCVAGSSGNDSAITVTTLCPLMPKGARNTCYVEGSGHVVSRTDKELSK